MCSLRPCSTPVRGQVGSRPPLPRQSVRSRVWGGAPICLRSHTWPASPAPGNRAGAPGSPTLQCGPGRLCLRPLLCPLTHRAPLAACGAPTQNERARSKTLLWGKEMPLVKLLKGGRAFWLVWEGCGGLFQSNHFVSLPFSFLSRWEHLSPVSLYGAIL